MTTRGIKNGIQDKAVKNKPPQPKAMAIGEFVTQAIISFLDKLHRDG